MCLFLLQMLCKSAVERVLASESGLCESRDERFIGPEKENSLKMVLCG